MIIDCISDLHGFYPELPGGDLLIVSGDLTARDSENEYALFDYWLNNQRYAAKIVIAGNHDNFLQDYGCNAYGLGHKYIQFGTYLQDSGTTFDGLKIWGSPWTKTFPGMNPRCKAFTCDTEEELAERFSLIPKDVDILITHSPPLGILDDVQDWEFGKIKNVGSSALHHLLYSEKIKPKIHAFGHIHEGYGVVDHMVDIPHTRFINASHVNERYKPVNKPIRIRYEN